MTAVYIVALAAGAPLLLWFAFSGDVGDAEVGDGDGGVFSFVSLGTLAFVSTFFGGAGLVSGWLGTGTAGSLLLALAVGLTAGVLNSAAFAWLRRTEASSEVRNSDIEGTIARVAVPVSTQRRGRIVLEVGGALTQMTASLLADGDELDVGARVIVVGVESGVALVTPLDPELR